jgi:hypothetical protein
VSIFTRIRLRRPGDVSVTRPLPPASYGQCRATAASTGRRCRLDAAPGSEYCGHFNHRPPPPTPRAA